MDRKTPAASGRGKPPGIAGAGLSHAVLADASMTTGCRLFDRGVFSVDFRPEGWFDSMLMTVLPMHSARNLNDWADFDGLPGVHS
jgi:hypothetical protein